MTLASFMRWVRQMENKMTIGGTGVCVCAPKSISHNLAPKYRHFWSVKRYLRCDYGSSLIAEKRLRSLSLCKIPISSSIFSMGSMDFESSKTRARNFNTDRIKVEWMILFLMLRMRLQKWFSLNSIKISPLIQRINCHLLLSFSDKAKQSWTIFCCVWNANLCRWQINDELLSFEPQSREANKE